MIKHNGGRGGCSNNRSCELRQRTVALVLTFGGLWGCDDAAPIELTASEREPLTITASGDTGIDQNQATTNNGTVSTCFINGERPGLGVRSCLMRWNLPSCGLVTSATVHLYVPDLVNAASDDDYFLFAIQRQWSESQATWLQAGSTPWEVPGARGSSDRGATVGVLTGDGQIGTHAVPLNPDGVAMVQSWINNPLSNAGIVIAENLIESPSQDILRVATRSSQDFARPRLEVTLLGGPVGTGGVGCGGTGGSGGAGSRGGP